MPDSDQIHLWKPVQQICEEMGLTIQTIRNMQQRFPELLPFTVVKGEKGFFPAEIDKLKQIVTAAQKGIDDEQIMRMLELDFNLEGPDEDLEEKLLEKIESLNVLLERQEKRQSEERDRLMVMLMRTQQEIQSLRFEVAATRSRRDRKKPWWRFMSRD